MYQPAADYNPMQNRLKEIIRTPEMFVEAVDLCLQIHAFLHQSCVSGSVSKTLCDEVVENLKEPDWCAMPTVKDVTIAWNIWHITRIEDITMNLLVAGGEQVLNVDWQKRLQTRVTDTGNAMTDDEIRALSKELNKAELLNYRRAVGTRSREILRSLSPADMKRKFPRERLDLLLAQGCLTGHPDSVWLTDFWGRKDVSGILLMPLTRHQAGHLNDCLKLKKKCGKLKG
jgi:hypothetical protein